MNKKTTVTLKRRMAYFIDELNRDANGEYIPCVAIENEAGYHKTTWRWGTDKDIAQQCVNARNAALGISGKDAALIVLSSMFPK